MATEMRLSTTQARQQFVQSLTAAWRRATEVFDPSVWLVRDFDAEEKMLRDADIAHAVGFRQKLVAGPQWTLIPRDDKHELAELACEVGTELLGAVKQFTQSRLNFARAFFSGTRHGWAHDKARILNIGDGKRRTWRVVWRIEDVDKRFIRTVPDNKVGEPLSAHLERWDVGAGKWEPLTRRKAMQLITHVYQDDQSTLGHGRALREALGWCWYAKTNVWQETLTAVERFAGGGIHAKVDGLRDAGTGETNTDLLNDWRDLLEDMRARHVLVSDARDELDSLPASGEGWQLLDVVEEKLKTSVSTLVLGANLPTQATQGGSYALGEIQENSTEAIVRFDREALEETLTDDLLGYLWWVNRPNLLELGIADQKPRFNITQEKRQDPQERASVAEILNRMGVDIAADDIYEQTGFRKPDDDEDKIAGSVRTDTFGMGVPGFGFEDTPAQPTVPGQDPLAVSANGEPMIEELQDTALNGAQVTAAAELILHVVNGEMPPGTAKLMLVSMFNLSSAEANAMIDEAVAFQPAPPQPEPAPVAAPAPEPTVSPR